MELQVKEKLRLLEIGEVFDNYTIVGYDGSLDVDLRKVRYLCKCGRCEEVTPVKWKTLISHTSGKCQRCSSMKYAKYLKEGEVYHGIKILSSKYRKPIDRYGGNLTPDLYEYLCECPLCETPYWALKTNIMQGRSSSCGCKGLESAKANRKLNRYEILEDGRVKMEFSNRENKHFYIDAEDFGKIKEYTWTELSNGYVYAHTEKKKCHLLHEFLLPPIKGFIVDHEDRNPVNCVRSNLRYATDSQNNVNKARIGTRDSEMSRVYMNPKRDAWIAKIKWEEVEYHLGTYSTEGEAVKDRIIAEQTFFKTFAVPVPDKFMEIYNEVIDELSSQYETYSKQYQKYLLAVQRERLLRGGGVLRKKRDRFNYYLETGKLE